jgi:hypothetical protein
MVHAALPLKSVTPNLETNSLTNGPLIPPASLFLPPSDAPLLLPSPLLSSPALFSFENHHMRWAYWVVKQNAVRVQHTSTGQSFLALIPYFNLIEKKVDSGGGVTFDLDGGISIRVGAGHEEGQPISTHPGNFTDTEFFLRYLTGLSLPLVLSPSSLCLTVL